MVPQRENPVAASSDDGSETINRESGGFHFSSGNFDGSSNINWSKRVSNLAKLPAILSAQTADEDVNKVTLMTDGRGVPVEPPSPRVLLQQSQFIPKRDPITYDRKSDDVKLVVADAYTNLPSIDIHIDPPRRPYKLKGLSPFHRAQMHQKRDQLI